ncbi:MAG: SCP2 sterol-binding domain-containing protein [Dehalococcoidia bacterium]|jgi:putative sterol carrier protein
MAKFGTMEWAQKLMEELNNSQGYAAAAKNWDGDWYWVINAGGPIKSPIYLYLDLVKDKCRSVDVLDEANKTKYKPAYILRGDVKTWRDIAEKKVDSQACMLTGRLKLTGNMPKLLRNTKVSDELIKCVGQVQTEWPE